ncbi:NADH dehydrogenase [ubiquinone] 1 beta subcomplex subunit 11, mitochondrial-like [Amphiura filiformis]|uniref:NADH dehydrogenase [ubiquinone] 1 beta subcomplex subunit 11, mitochondrial-like n=1 Tax=Amphiura filiformis TaxID=82378 RepID=UPI003B220A31
MASVMAGICRNGCRFLHRIHPNISQVSRNISISQCCAYSSTSKKVEQSEFVLGRQTVPDPKRVEELKQEDLRDPRIEITDPNDPQYENKGYYNDPIDDAYTSKVVLFSTLSITFVGIFFYCKYIPDLRQRDWSRREALRVMAEKEAAGETLLINPDFIPLDKLIVPTDEEMDAVENRKK